MPDLSMFSGFIVQWLVNPVIWIVVMLAIIGIGLIMLYIRKKRKLTFSLIEVVDLGGGKIGLNNCKAGWFGKKLYLRGLWWTGEEVLRLSTGEQIYEFGTLDYQEINGKRGILAFRDPMNQNILVPLTNCEINNKDLIADIAPASYRDAALDIYNEAKEETKDWKEKVMQVAVYAIGVAFIIIVTLVVIHFIKESQAKAAELLMQAGDKGIANCKAMCSELVNVVRGSSP